MMKIYKIIVISVFLSGCIFEFPLTKEHNIPIDDSLIDLWYPLPIKKGEKLDTKKLMLITRFSGTEYLIRYPMDEKLEYYIRGYPIKVGNFSYVQLEVIGTTLTPSRKDSKKMYSIVSYSVKGDDLAVRIPKVDLIGRNYNAEELRKAILKHQSNNDLFTQTKNFIRLKQPPGGRRRKKSKSEKENSSTLANEIKSLKSTEWYKKQKVWKECYPFRSIWLGKVKKVNIKKREIPNAADSFVLSPVENIDGNEERVKELWVELFSVENPAIIKSPPKIGETWTVSCTVNSKGHFILHEAKKQKTLFSPAGQKKEGNDRRK